MPHLHMKRDIAEKRKTINQHFDTIVNPKFSYMRESLDFYHLEIEKGLRENIKIENENFKKHFFSSLENLLTQVSLIKNEKNRNDRIDDILVWYNKRIQFFKDVNTIKERTSKNIWENVPEVDKIKKSSYYEAKEYPLFFESKHRTEVEGLVGPKER